MPTEMPEPGCYVDGWWGQYAPARVIQIALEGGWDDDEARDLAARHLAAMGPSTEPGLVGDEFERMVEASNDAENWLNEQPRPEGHYWGWGDGEFGLYPNEED